MLRLLNHPNLVSLVDIVHGTQSGFDYTVWEHCSRGTLARPLHDLKYGEWVPKLRRYNPLTLDRGRSVPASVPEDFSWHVLEGIGAALCWLHTGMKVTFPFGRGMRHDPDWHTILHKDIHPSNSMPSFEFAFQHTDVSSLPLPPKRNGAIRSGEIGVLHVYKRVCQPRATRSAARVPLRTEFVLASCKFTIQYVKSSH